MLALKSTTDEWLAVARRRRRRRRRKRRKRRRRRRRRRKRRTPPLMRRAHWSTLRTPAHNPPCRNRSVRTGGP